MRLMVRRAIGLVALGIALASAGGVAAASGEGPLDGTAWVLASLVGRAVAGSPAVTLQFDGGRLSGTDGCNRFSAGYTATGSELAVSPQIASTQMACPPEVEAKARAFLAALTGAKRYRVHGARLELLAEDGTTLAALAAQSLVLTGTSWRATGINNGRQAVVSVVNGTSVTLSFGADGDASGQGGCNHYSGHYEANGSQITIGRVAVTEMSCTNPPGVMEQEQAYLKALGTASTVRFEGNRLELRTADGALAVGFERAPGG
jgi:heat shock protein HslJ